MKTTSLITCPCNHCSGFLEFESGREGQAVRCPHCGLDTVLFRPNTATSPIPQAIPTKPSESEANPNLYRCPDCKREVSIHAESCPHCGANLRNAKRHGVFFYVFWGVISLIATVVIIFFIVAAIGGFLEGWKQVHKPAANETVVSVKQEPIPLTPEEISDAKAILAAVYIEKDEVEGITWIHPTAKSHEYGNKFVLYIGIHDGQSFIRLRIGYSGEDWLFVKSFVIRIDDHREVIELSESLQRDINNGLCYEWFDKPAGPYLPLLKMIARGDTVICRYQGDQHYSDKTIPLGTKEWLAKMMLVYRYLEAQSESELHKLNAIESVEEQRRFLMKNPVKK